MRSQTELENILQKLRSLPAETEWVEFKEAKSSYSFDKIGRYFSALSNEANLKSQTAGWLVFGVENKHHKIVDSQFRPNRPDLDSLKHEIAKKTTNHLSFVEIYELSTPDGRVILFEIPPAPKGMPIAWEGHYYGRDGESLAALNIHEIEQIRQQTDDDWSAQICENATFEDLDPRAIRRARQLFAQRHPHLSADVAEWDDLTFLNKAKMTRDGLITRAAIILIGRDEAEHHINPATAKMTWLLRNEAGDDRDFEHFGPPFLLNTDAILAKIRNLKYRFLPDNTLFPHETTQYDPYVIRETLHNCIAHQDYRFRGGRISVVENPDDLLFSNVGSFIPGSIDAVIERNAPPDFYRNPFLVQAMLNLKMIETLGSGIRKMFVTQQKRFFPMPDYDLSELDRVRVKIYGKILDENYTRILMNDSDLPLTTAMALDRVQKKRGHELSDDQIKQLRAEKLIEGRKPNYFVAAKIAQITDKKAEYTKFKAFDKKYYQDLILKFLEQHGQASRLEIDQLLWNKLPEFLNDKQRKNKINNLLNEMSNKLNLIKNTGSRTQPVWIVYSRDSH